LEACRVLLKIKDFFVKHLDATSRDFIVSEHMVRE